MSPAATPGTVSLADGINPDNPMIPLMQKTKWIIWVKTE
jgi:hypothetical protein